MTNNVTNSVPSNVSERDLAVETHRKMPPRPAIDLGREPIMWQRGEEWVFALPMEWPADGPDPLSFRVLGDGTGQWCWRGDKSLDGLPLRCTGLEWILQHDADAGVATALATAQQVGVVLRGFV